MSYSILGVSPRNEYQWKLGKEKIQFFLDRDDVEIVSDTPYLKIFYQLLLSRQTRLAMITHPSQHLSGETIRADIDRFRTALVHAEKDFWAPPKTG